MPIRQLRTAASEDAADAPDVAGVRPGADTRAVLALHALGVEGYGGGRTPALPRSATGLALADLRSGWVGTEGGPPAALARLLDSRLRPPVAAPEPRRLSDVYREVLDPARVRLAERTPTPGERARYDAARALLTPQVVRTYLGCATALGAARLERAVARAAGPPPAGEGTAAGDAARQLQVARAEARVAAAEAALAGTGRAAEVHAALAVVGAWPDTAPAASWEEHRRQPAVRSESGRTRLVPTDVLAGRGWTGVDLPASAIAPLVAGLPPEVAATGGDPAQDAGLSRITAELACVEVLRPWFDPAILRSTAWRFTDDRPPLSDGGSPASGDYPYLVAGLVLARSLCLVPAAPGVRPRLGYLARGVGRPAPAPARPAAPAAARPGEWAAQVDFPGPPVPPAPRPPAGGQLLVGAERAVVVAYLLEPVGRAPAADPALSSA